MRHLLRSVSTLAGCLILLFALSACGNQAESGTTNSTPTKRVTSETVVKVEAPAVEINAGASTEATVRLKIDAGYHVNANPASFPYLIATQLEVPTVDGISAAKITYPPALKKTFSFSSEGPLAVYENEAELKVTLLAASSAKRGQTSIPSKLRIQACDDQVCYPPGTIDVWIPVTVN